MWWNSELLLPQQVIWVLPHLRVSGNVWYWWKAVTAVWNSTTKSHEFWWLSPALRVGSPLLSCFTLHRFLFSQETPNFLISSIYPQQFPFETLSLHLISSILYQLAPWQSLSPPHSACLYVYLGTWEQKVHLWSSRKKPKNFKVPNNKADAAALQRAVAALHFFGHSEVFTIMAQTVPPLMLSPWRVCSALFVFFLVAGFAWLKN